MVTTFSVQPTSRVVAHLLVTLADGSVVESSKEQGKPALFCLGDGSLSAPLEAQLLGLTVGAKADFVLPATTIVGEFNPDLVHYFSRFDFAQLDNIEVGSIILFDAPDGGQMPGVISDMVDDSVTVDFNHPLIGKMLHFHIDILEIDPSIEANYANPVS